MAGKPYIREITDIEQMAKETTVMVTKSVDAYVNRDLKLAQEVIGMDAAAAASMVGIIGVFNGGGRIVWSTIIRR